MNALLLQIPATGGFLNGDYTIYIIFIVFALLSWVVQKTLQSKFKKYSEIRLPMGLSGKEVAERMLRENGINDVQVLHTPGQLTDISIVESARVSRAHDDVTMRPAVCKAS